MTSPMLLPRKGREYARITFTNLPTDATSIEASIDGGATWTATEVGTDPTERLLLVRGPEYTSGDPSGLLVTATVTVLVRVTDNPEAIIRRAGQIQLT